MARKSSESARLRNTARSGNRAPSARSASPHDTAPADRTASPGHAASPGAVALPRDVVRLRAKMDRLNARLAADVQARARLALEIARAKAAHGLAAADPQREQAMLRRVLDEAPDGFPRCDLARIFKTIFVASRGLVLAERTGAPSDCNPRRPRR